MKKISGWKYCILHDTLYDYILTCVGRLEQRNASLFYLCKWGTTYFQTHLREKYVFWNFKMHFKDTLVSCKSEDMVWS